VNHTDAISENALPSVLPDYVRFQVGQQPRPAPASINRRLTVVCCALRNAFPDADHPAAAPDASHFCRLHPPLGFGRFRPKRSRFRVKGPKAFPRRVRWIRLPITHDCVSLSGSGCRTATDKATVGLMTLQGI